MNQRKPEYWPTNQTWPLPPGVSIVSIKELMPPIYILSNGKKINGVRKPIKKIKSVDGRCTMVTKKKTRCKRSAVDGEHFCSFHGGKIYLFLHKLKPKERNKWMKENTFL